MTRTASVLPSVYPCACPRTSGSRDLREGRTNAGGQRRPGCAAARPWGPRTGADVAAMLARGALRRLLRGFGATGLPNQPRHDDGLPVRTRVYQQPRRLALRLRCGLHRQVHSCHATLGLERWRAAQDSNVCGVPAAAAPSPAAAAGPHCCGAAVPLVRRIAQRSLPRARLCVSCAAASPTGSAGGSPAAAQSSAALCGWAAAAAMPTLFNRSRSIIVDLA